MTRFAPFVVVLLLATTASAEDPAIAAVEKLGGEAKIDPKLDEIAQVAVTLPVGTDAALLALGKLPSVGAINIADASKVTEKGYAGLKELPDLQKLVLGKSNATDKSALVIGSIRTLSVIYLGESKITDAGIVGFGKLKFLRELDLLDAKLTDKGVVQLAPLVKLEELNLSGTKVTDAAVPVLLKLEGLKLLKLIRTDVTRDGVTKLETGLPKATVRW